MIVRGEGLTDLPHQRKPLGLRVEFLNIRARGKWKTILPS